MKSINKFFNFFLILLLVFNWVFQYPPFRFWRNLGGREIQEAQAADITIDTGDTSPIAVAYARALVWTSASVGYFFYIDSDNDFKYAKTTNGGSSWTPAVAEIDTDTTITALAFDVWYDKWTTGDSGTKIHIWWANTDTDSIQYRALDTSNDTLGTRAMVFDGASGASNRANFVSGTKARGGNLYVVGTIDAAAECEFGRSTDGGATWDITRTSPQEACGDQGFLYPGNEVDTNDIWMLYDDVSADALTLKTNDDSANTWSESATIATVVENTTLGTGEFPFSGSIRQSDNHLIAAVHTELDTATADFRIFDINGAASVTEKTAITTNIDDNYYSSVFIDQNTNNIYVSYAGKRDGSETLGTTVGIYYTKSTDGGVNWSAGDTAYSESTGNFRQNWAGMMGNRFGVVWRNDATEGLLFNYVNSLDLTPTVVSTTGTQTANMNVNSTNNYVGGAFTFIRDSGTANVTQIIITDTGTVNANLNLSNVDLYYETAASCSYEANETLFGTGTSFNASEKATVSGTMAVGTSQVCVYVVLDVGSGATGGQTIEIEISNPSTEVSVSAGTVSPASVVAISGTTTLQSAPTVSCNTSTSTTDFGALTTSSVHTSSPNITITGSCTYSSGCTLNVDDAGDTTNPGLYKSVSPTDLINSQTATLSAGTEGYGIQATTTANGSGGTLTLSGTYNKTGNDVGGLNLAATALASSTTTYTDREVVITHKATISPLNKAGSYADTITYSCVGN
ncbi:MAG: hypothetical protein AB1721_00250 [Patescibacteria group bacterium]